MQSSKLVFSESELQLALNQEVILTKIAIIEKVCNQFGAVGDSVFEYCKVNALQYLEELSVLPKISKGENYLGFPWVMLDYPRFFDKENGHFALRNFFWWGNYFLVQLHVSNKYSIELIRQLNSGLFPLKIENFSVWAGYPDDPWNYQIPQDGMFELKAGFRLNATSTREILKIAIMVPLEQYDKIWKASLALCSLFLGQSAAKPVK